MFMLPHLELGTHDGFFHADEVVALALIDRIRVFHGCTVAPIVRSRDPQMLATAGILVDVGGEYNPADYKFDHHMKEGVPSYGELYQLSADHPLAGIKLASAGMVWHAIGHKYPGVNSEELHAQIALSIFAPIDAVDNGQASVVGDTKQLTISQLIAGFNVNPAGMDNESWEYVQATAFQKAMEWASVILEQLIDSKIATAALKQKAVVAFEKAIDEESDILYLEESLPWKEAALDTWDHNQHIQLVIMPHPSGMWYIQTLTSEKDALQSQRCSAPKQIRGLRDQALNDATGCSGCVFIHPSGFLGAANTLAEASLLARWWIDHSNK